MKSPDVQPETYIKYGIEHDGKDPKLKFNHRARISKYKNIFAKGYTPNWYGKLIK